MSNSFTKLEVQKMPKGGISTYNGGIYCGPGWGFTIEDVRSKKFPDLMELPAAKDAIDEVCRIHDQCYQDFGYFTQQCNVSLAVNLVEIIFSKTSSNQQRIDATIMAAVFAVEAAYIDPQVKPVLTTYSYLKLQISGLWGKGQQTMQQVIIQVGAQYRETERTLLSRAGVNY